MIELMKLTGTKMTASESVVASTASAISRVPSYAARIGVMPFSSTWRKMFSSTTIASSITMPTISTSASIVTLLSVKSSSHIIANVLTTDAGIATPAMITLRQLRVNASTTKHASALPRIRWRLISCRAA